MLTKPTAAAACHRRASASTSYDIVLLLDRGLDIVVSRSAALGAHYAAVTPFHSSCHDECCSYHQSYLNSVWAHSQTGCECQPSTGGKCSEDLTAPAFDIDISTFIYSE